MSQSSLEAYLFIYLFIIVYLRTRSL